MFTVRWIMILILLSEFKSCFGMFSYSQQVALALLPKFSAMISIFGCVFVMNLILFIKPARRLSYHRYIFGVTFADLLTSIGCFLSTWPIPADAPYIAFNVGNSATCTAQGFIVQLGLATIFYSGCLVFNYFLVLYMNWSQAQVRRIEPYLHAFAICFPLATAIAVLIMGDYGNTYLWCWITDPDFQYAFFFAPLWITWFLILIATILVWYSVQQHEKRIKETLYEGGEAHKYDSKSRKFAIEGTLYVVAFCFTWIFGTICRTYRAATGNGSYTLSVLHVFFVPLQGFLNAIVFGRVEYRKLRASHPKLPTKRLLTHLFFPFCIPIKYEYGHQRDYPMRSARSDTSRNQISTTKAAVCSTPEASASFPDLQTSDVASFREINVVVTDIADPANESPDDNSVKSDELSIIV